MEVSCWNRIGIVLFTRLLVIVLGNVENMPEFLVEEDEVDCADGMTDTLTYIHVPWNEPFRAFKTLPSEVRLGQSIIPEGGMGVFANTFIKRYTWLAEYEGEVVIKLIQISDYAWKVKRHGKKSFYVDAHDIRTSNWVRWINCPRHLREENVEVRECKGRMYYVTTRDIYPGVELMVYYGDGYAKDLFIDIDNYENMEPINYVNDQDVTTSSNAATTCDKNCSDNKPP